MFVMGELNSELQGCSRIAKRVTPLIARRRLQMADKTNLRIGAFKKLTPVTRDTGIVIGVVGDVGVIPDLSPVLSWTLMTGDTRSTVLVSRMGESGVGNPGSRRDWTAPGACLRCGREIANDDCYKEGG